MEVHRLHARRMGVCRWHLEDLETERLATCIKVHIIIFIFQAERLATVSCCLRRADGLHWNPPVPPSWSSNRASAATLVRIIYIFFRADVLPGYRLAPAAQIAQLYFPSGRACAANAGARH